MQRSALVHFAILVSSFVCMFAADSTSKPTSFNALLSEFGFSLNSAQDLNDAYSSYQFLLGVNDRQIVRVDRTTVQVNSLLNLAVLSDSRVPGNSITPVASANNMKLETVVSYGAGWILDPCVTLSLATPMIDSYTKTNARTGGFADPFQRVASLGMAYQVLTPQEIFSAKFSGSSNWTTSRDAVSSTDLPSTPAIEYSKHTFTRDLQLDYQNTRDSIVNYVFKSALKYDLTDSEKYKIVSSAEVRLRFLSQFGLINKLDVTYDPFITRRLIYRVTLSVNVMLGPNF